MLDNSFVKLHTATMKAADKITTVRIILAPVFFVVYHFNKFFPALPKPSGFLRWWQIPALWAVFIVAELTDMIDGKTARKRGEASDFGKFYDPFADTIFQITLFFCFVWDQILPMIPFLLVLYREFAILFVRNLMQKKGISMGARMGGKIKTVVYISTGILALLVFDLRLLAPSFTGSRLFDPHDQLFFFLSVPAVVVFWIAVLLSLLSFFDYVRVYRRSGTK
jgi:CDP-diacylglycerol--glycerol-3-phosphate 3-phosphatidyltransferase